MPKKRSAALITLAILLPLPVLGQPNRVAARIDSSQRISLRGHVHPKAVPEFDQGAVDPALTIPDVTLVLKPSPGQQAALDQLLAEQQDSFSPNYHKWLTPEQFADQFGASQDDIDRIVEWLQQQALTVTSVSRARNAISVTGSAAAVGQAFGLELHYYLVSGERHFANAAEPTIPAALAGIVGAIRGLHDFRMKPASLRRKAVPNAAQPDYTSGTGIHSLAPGDIATIYNLKPLFGMGVDGTGQSLVVVGQSQVRLADIELYRSTFNLPAKDPQLILVPGATDPGIKAGDLLESEIDLEISGAVAPNANILFVYSSDAVTSARYAIDQNLAKVISMSYGSCEAEYTTSDATSLEAIAQQANAQGITWFASSGDSGATGCAGSGSSTTGDASVEIPASLPEVTGIGGTAFVEGGGTYWNPANDANGGSARSYIPETAWNDTALRGSPAASGGGASVFFPKPSWQAGPGVPADGARDVPDIAFAASPDHDAFLIYSSDGLCPSATTACSVGGTSTGPPAFAGLAALLNQQLVVSGKQSGPGLGNINPKLYTLAQSASAAFHDITTGNNMIIATCPWPAPTPSNRPCTPGSVGFVAGTGYDQVTGLGSVDATALVTKWTTSSMTTHFSVMPASLTATAGVPVQFTVTALTAGNTTDVTYSDPVHFTSTDPAAVLPADAALTNGLGTFTASLATPGTQTLTAADLFTASINGTSGNITVAALAGPPSVSGVLSSSLFGGFSAVAPGSWIEVHGSNLAAVSRSWTLADFKGVVAPTSLDGSSVAIGSQPAAIASISSTMLLVQVPSQVAPGSPQLVVTTAAGVTSPFTVTVNALEPGVYAPAFLLAGGNQYTSEFNDFMEWVLPTGASSASSRPARAGDFIVVWGVGFGPVTPNVPTGTIAQGLTTLTTPVQFSIGGVPATVLYQGLAPGEIGLYQFDLVVPNNVAAGNAVPLTFTQGSASGTQTLYVAIQP